MATSSLRSVDYTYHFPVANNDGTWSSPSSGDISDLFRDANPYMFTVNPVPPLRIVNAFLVERETGGMGGGAAWEPFVLSDAEYTDFLAYLDTPAGQKKFQRKAPVELASPPAEVASLPDWHQWLTRERMKDPHHHFNTMKGFVSVEGRRVPMSMGEAILRGLNWSRDR